MSFEELKQEFKSNGFRIEEDYFITEIENTSMTINGRHPMMTFVMKYIGDGNCETDEDSDVEIFYYFDILDDQRQTAYTIGISSFKDFTELAR